MPVSCADFLGPAAEALLECARQALVDCERPVSLVSLAPGNTVSWDNCCEGGGQLWVRIVSVVPQPVQSQVCDIDSLQVRLGLGVIRCMHGLTDEGFPTAAQMTQDTLDMALDSTILLNAIRCCGWTPQVVQKTLKVETGLPQGPQGTCGGWEWTLTFRLGVCAAC